MSPRSTIVFREARIDEIVDLRWRILRAGLPRDTAIFDGDEESTTHHFAACEDKTVLACATFLRRPFEGQSAWQLRGMAVAAERQRTGLGGQLLNHAEAFVLDKNHSRLFWCNARVPASGFYLRRGWRIVSEPFEIPTAGPHVKMSRQF